MQLLVHLFIKYHWQFVIKLIIFILQVVNYGIGGHYEPHYDHAQVGSLTSFSIYKVIKLFLASFQEGEDPFSDSTTGNRIATLLFYVC